MLPAVVLFANYLFHEKPEQIERLCISGNILPSWLLLSRPIFPVPSGPLLYSDPSAGPPFPVLLHRLTNPRAPHDRRARRAALSPSPSSFRASSGERRQCALHHLSTFDTAPSAVAFGSDSERVPLQLAAAPCNSLQLIASPCNTL